MSKLYTEQQEGIEPIEFTHFDCWFNNDEIENSDNLTMKADEVLNNWEKTLNVKFNRDGMTFNDWVEVNDSFTGICYEIVELGYGVYLGGDFIEIYPKGELKQYEVHLARTEYYSEVIHVEAHNEEEACEMAWDRSGNWKCVDAEEFTNGIYLKEEKK